MDIDYQLYQEIALVFSAIFTAAISVYIIRKKKVMSWVNIDQTIMNATFGVVGTMLSILLAFAIAVVWGSYGDARSISVQEANALGDIERMSRGFSMPVRRQVRSAVDNYTRLVIDEEWPSMSKGEYSERADAIINELWTIYSDIPKSERVGNSAMFNQTLVRLNDLTANRRMRLLSSSPSVPGLMWMLLYCDAFAIILLTTCFRIPSLGVHILLVTVTAGVISFSFYLIKSLDTPFSGAVQIESTPFQVVRNSLQQIEY